MREIKFRAWSIYGKRMCNWETIKTNSKMYSYFDWPDIFNLMQYTGLKDKNGKEIYEGDIIKYEGMGFREYGIGRVVWKEVETHGAHEPTPFCWNIVGYTKTSGKFITDGDGSPIIDELDEPIDDGLGEVIGNIYENKELLCQVNK